MITLELQYFVHIENFLLQGPHLSIEKTFLFFSYTVFHLSHWNKRLLIKFYRIFCFILKCFSFPYFTVTNFFSYPTLFYPCLPYFWNVLFLHLLLWNSVSSKYSILRHKSVLSGLLMTNRKQMNTSKLRLD